ncbi:hypothetical protein KGA66_13000 [Actinocrinis puniceicyclus]|uniref:Uncharacterized protein n=1 Tax=Actinocrinis puniceicyclus TaxID=977794 RepID=A0A8J8BBE7_9ACTN|nr:hypothetical protein [Actinocrinis puniceicyclus]MBS2963967.1 hypothetical protein [Actinocrinis puniceicyclus]
MSALLDAQGENVKALLERSKPWPRQADGPAAESRERPALSAARAVLSVALALAAPDSAAELVRQSSAHWQRAEVVPGGLPHAFPDALFATSDRQLRSVLHQVEESADGPAAAYVALVALALRAGLPSPAAQVELPVLFDRGGSGGSAVLRLRALPVGPSGLYPDPVLMPFLVSDAAFGESLLRAWSAAPQRPEGWCVTWAIVDHEVPCNDVIYGSLGAAFAVALDELTRRLRRWLGRIPVVRLKQLDHRWAVSGVVGADGNLGTVTGCDRKLEAARQAELRVVFPEVCSPDAAPAAKRLHVTVGYAADVRQAVQLTRKRFTKGFWAAVTTVAVTAAVGGSLLYSQHLSTQARDRVQATRDTAARVAATADQLSVGDSGGLSLLLAMASDDIAASTGQSTDTFDSLARNYSTLVHILRPQHGRYEEPAVSGDGTLALLDTTAGSVQLVSTKAGRVLWQHDYPPGLELSARQVYVDGLAFSPKGQAAAFASSDLKITVLAPAGAAWTPGTTLTLPVPSKRGPLNFELNAAKLLGFSPDGTSIVAYGDRSGLFRFDLGHPAAPPVHCTEPSDVVGLAVAGDGALLVRPHEITKVNPGDCSMSTVMTAPAEATWQCAVIQANGVPVGFATRGSQLLALQPGEAEVVLGDRGPYSQVHATLSSDDVHVSASTSAVTVGWQVTRHAQEFGLRAPGVAAASEGDTVWVHDGIAEILDRGHTPATVKAVRFIGGQSVAWAGPDLVIRRFSNVYVAPGGASGLNSASARMLASPPGESVLELATSPGGPWAGAILSDKTGTRKSVLVWDVPSGRQLPTATGANDVPMHVAFCDAELFVSYRDGDLRRYGLRDGHWAQAGSLRLSGHAQAIGCRDGADSLYAVVADNSDSPPTAVKVRRSDLAVVATTRLTGATGLARLVVLQDGQVVIGYGDGQVIFLDPQLFVRGTYADSTLAYVLGIAEVPGFNQVIVSGRAKSIVLDRVTRLPQAGVWTIGGPFISADASGDGRLLATYNFFGAELDIWSLTKPDLRRRVCQAVGRDLTAREWATFVGPNPTYHPVCAGLL